MGINEYQTKHIENHNVDWYLNDGKVTYIKNGKFYPRDDFEYVRDTRVIGKEPHRINFDDFILP